MKLTDLNSAQDIGANSLLVEIGGLNLLIDAGMHPKKEGLACLPHLNDLPPLDYIILTHCHLDHIGALPVVLRKQPGLEILCSPASAIVAKRILRNSVSVMLRQRDETGIKEYPLFTYNELDAVERALHPIPLMRPRTLFPRHAALPDKFQPETPPSHPTAERDNASVNITLYPAGHVAGAVGVLVEHKHRRIFFTGDVLFHDQETVPAAQFPDISLDTLVMETTHGATPVDNDITRAGETARLLETINTTITNGGSVLIPVFAFGRMQEILTILNKARLANALASCPIYCSGLGVDLVDYIDQMSRKAGFVNFRRHILQDLRIRPLDRQFTPIGKDLPTKGIYLLSSGMLVENTPAWRVAANLLEYPKNTLCFVGYCDPETPGGRLLARKHGDTFLFNSLDHIAKIRAHIENFYFSGHASRDELIAFAKRCDPRAIVLTHGDPPAREWFEEELATELPSAKVTNPSPKKQYTV
ncbi:MAG: MBL fold metallo-hydrolase [Puniceicoccales bacterium]|jgi:Cft2 family RNA processing exonuclease|nr:MBL fold metallo-hydrolase [Puniceicoccales bacterium]